MVNPPPPTANQPFLQTQPDACTTVDQEPEAAEILATVAASVPTATATPPSQLSPVPSSPRPSRSEAASRPRVRLPPLNRALAELVAERDAAEAKAPGACHLCRVRPGRSGCHGCPARVCFKDRWLMFGLCKGCLRPEDLRRWHQSGRVEASNWLDQ